MSVFDPVTRLEREHAANAARIEDFKAKITTLVASQKDAEDFDTLDDIDGKIAALERKLRLAEGVAANSAQRLAKALAEAAEREADAEHAAMLKRQKASAKRVRALPEKFAPLIAELEWLEAENAAFAEYSGRRAARAFIPDPEQEARQIPGRTEPAVFEDRAFWRDSAGNQPTIFVTDRETGEMRPQEAGYSRRVERVCVQPERIIAPTTPDRLADLLPALQAALRG